MSKEKRVLKGAYVKCKRWFDKVNGNTYHDVTIQFRKGPTAYLPAQYGYDEQCFQTAKEFLLKEGILSKEYESMPFWQIVKRFNLETDIQDVTRRTELNNW